MSTTHSPLPVVEEFRVSLVDRGRRRIGQERARRRAVRGSLAGGVSLAVAGALGLGLWPGGGPAVDSAVAGTLERAAIASDGAGLEDVAPGQYWYEEVASRQVLCCELPDGSELPPDPPLEQARYESWTGVDGVGADVRHEEGPRPGDPETVWASLLAPQGVDLAADLAPGFADELAGYSTDSDRDGAGRQFRVPGGDGAGWGSYEELAALPTDPVELRALIVDSLDRTPLGIGEPPLELQVFTAAADMLHQPLPSDLRVALFGVLTQTGGSSQGEATDLTGRTVTTVGMADEANGVRQELLFDPATGRYVGERTVLAREPEWYDGEVGDLVYESVVSRAGIVDELGERPGD